MTVPRETMRLIYRAVAFTGQWPWVNFQGSRSWNGVPPGIMKMQLRILRLRLGMTAPRETMRLIFKAGPSTDHPATKTCRWDPDGGRPWRPSLRMTSKNTGSNGGGFLGPL